MEVSPPPLEHHTNLVAIVSSRVHEFHLSKTPFRIYHGSTNSTRTVIRDPATTVDISALNNILYVDKENRIASVEPNVPMDELVRATLEHDLIPPVIPEFPGITVGGGFAGSAGESSSFKYGFLDATVEKVEVVLGDGQVREVGHDGSEEDKELFYALAGTLGTLGVLTRLDIRLVEAKPFVELTYHSVTGFKEAKNVLECAIAKEAGNDFVDGIMYGPSKGAIITGRMVSKTYGGKVTRFSRSTDEWCFIHAEEMISDLQNLQIQSNPDRNLDNQDISDSETSTISPPIDYVPLTDYLFRYDRGAFWMGKYGCAHFLLPFTKTTRTLLDSLFHTREMYTALHASRMQQHHIVEDLAVPFSDMVPFLHYLDDDFGIYPLWLCPLKFQSNGLQIKHLPKDTDLLLNVGVWGPWGKKHKSFKDANMALEAKVKDLKGIKWLYAQTFYTRNEFWEIYDEDSYQLLRKKYTAVNLPCVYEKVKQPERPKASPTWLASLWDIIFSFWLVGGIYGLFQAWRRADYILRK